MTKVPLSEGSFASTQNLSGLEPDYYRDITQNYHPHKEQKGAAQVGAVTRIVLTRAQIQPPKVRPPPTKWNNNSGKIRLTHPGDTRLVPQVARPSRVYPQMGKGCWSKETIRQWTGDHIHTQRDYFALVNHLGYPVNYAKVASRRPDFSVEEFAVDVVDQHRAITGEKVHEILRRLNNWNRERLVGENRSNLRVHQLYSVAAERSFPTNPYNKERGSQ